MEVAARDDQILIGEDGGIVGHGVELGKQDRSHVTDAVFGRPMHLWDAAERVRILHVLFGLLDELTPL